MALQDEDEQRRAERAHQVALFRYQLIREAADTALSARQRGALVRAIAATTHTDPFGKPVRVSRNTLDRWLRAWRSGGFDALLPPTRQVTPRTPTEVLDLAAALKRENPARTTAQVVRILAQHLGWGPSYRTIHRHFQRLELITRPDGSPPAAFGRFEADRPNELWIGDALHGPRIAGRKTYLFAFVDDHSRMIVGHRWGGAEDTVRLAAALRPALAARGVPEGVYVDNGSAFVDAALLRACARLGIKLIHSTPGRPQGRGKIERLFRTVREQFLVEVDPERISDLAELNRLFTAWVEQVYHRRVHSETGAQPWERWNDGAPFPQPTPAALREAFRWSERRTVTKTATVSLHSNIYEVDRSLVGRKVELVFDPFDLVEIEVRYQDRPFGLARPHQLSRHAHPKARPETPAAESAPATGIDYLRLIDTARTSDLAGRINYTALVGHEPDGDGEQQR
ncbi:MULTISPECIES: DDE-type integrase/transposase/recombinase [unclassified Crossiella]|uniref:DDE-type integrase/transposase/recombinase n=1 Tax=unclassified Crossiella TaxID=2620835 RepID=UPI00200031F1|nr:MULTISPECIES: DDE-type integrase/transposase/recombinase [unclassified Crossiella]MCK2245210.1 DDE-type integrase/transposase/recombinase [Crossiella sp. S99.2]MCK2258868.1 DDE-type integrase/transposase/recombinase [Crossiella sp. S99.1]